MSRTSNLEFVRDPNLNTHNSLPAWHLRRLEEDLGQSLSAVTLADASITTRLDSTRFSESQLAQDLVSRTSAPRNPIQDQKNCKVSISVVSLTHSNQFLIRSLSFSSSRLTLDSTKKSHSKNSPSL
ncbi:hypothetical protein PGT21_019456 [Puccinia graminis f. sp. tritici]|uniref:Uncharacterized protein n=1 Tax=Puccinia graminis f. sp. tritici TaxID=56615 RepID=A0A5B0LMT7_PUCGR|nr:hypothetical protein PGT21_019456 [Puccinia graminis f. sp. tritici]